MNVVLRPELERLVGRKLATGRYADRGAAIEEALVERAVSDPRRLHR